MTEERKIKHDRVVEYLRSHDLDAVLLSRRCNFSWYTCGAHNHVADTCDVGNSHLLVRSDGAVVLTDNIEAARLRAEELAGGDIEVIDFSYCDAQSRSNAFAVATSLLRVASDAPLNGIDAAPLAGDFDSLRWTLTEWEIGRYRSLADDTVAAVESCARAARPGMTENELAGSLASTLRAKNCLPWVLLVGADERVERFRHPLATDRRAERYVMLVTCAERDGLIANCTRFASFGSVSDELADRHQAVCTVDAAMISATRPGETLGDLFAIVQEAYAAVGFPDQWRMHHQGGSCGYLPREIKATPGETTQVLADQAFAWNPSITGTKSEDTILCRGSGTELLHGRTDFPAISVEYNGAAMDRPAILEL